MSDEKVKIKFKMSKPESLENTEKFKMSRCFLIKDI
jgi:hypothetical protein